MQIHTTSFHFIKPENCRIYERENTLFAEEKGFLSWITCLFSRLGLNARNYNLTAISKKLEGQFTEESPVYSILKNRITAYNKTHQPFIEFAKLLKKVEKVVEETPPLVIEIPKSPAPFSSFLNLSTPVPAAPPSPPPPTSPSPKTPVSTSPTRQAYGWDTPPRTTLETKLHSIEFVFQITCKDGLFSFSDLLRDCLLCETSPLRALKYERSDSAKQISDIDDSFCNIHFDADFKTIPKDSFEILDQLIPILYQKIRSSTGIDYVNISENIRSHLNKASPERLLEIFHIAQRIGVIQNILTLLERVTFEKIYNLPDFEREKLAALYGPKNEHLHALFQCIDTFWFTYKAQEQFPWSDKEEDVAQFQFFKEHGDTKWGKMGVACCTIYGIGTPKITINKYSHLERDSIHNPFKNIAGLVKEWKSKGNLFAKYGYWLLENDRCDLEELALSDHLSATFYLAKYKHGTSIETWQNIAAKNVPQANTILGDRALENFSKNKKRSNEEVKRDYQNGNEDILTAIAFYEKAAKYGSREASLYLLAFSTLLSIENKRYLSWFQNTYAFAYQVGHVGELFELSLTHIDSDISWGEKKEGIRLLKRLAKHNLPPAMYLLGHCYKTGMVENEDAHIERELRKSGNHKEADQLNEAWMKRCASLGNQWQQKAKNTRPNLDSFSSDSGEMWRYWESRLSEYPHIGEVTMPKI